MAIILIKPVNIKTIDGHDAEITGIDPTDYNCLIGIVHGQAKSVDVKWNTDGTCSGYGAGDGARIDPKDSEFLEVIKTLEIIKK